MEWPSPVKNYHRDTYPAINPTSPRLSTSGKNVVITGGGSGKSPRTPFVSGAASFSILGRTETTLIETKNKLETDYPKTRVYTYIADIVDKVALVTAFESIKSVVGEVHILIANAGYLPAIKTIVGSDLKDWYNGFEVNVRGNFNVVIAFVPVAEKDASIVNISTRVTHLGYLPGYSAYHTSKLASAKFFEYVHHKYPDFFVLNVHPGVIGATMDAKTVESGTELPYDEIELPADFVVWAVSPEANFLNGKFVWAHWDIEDLQAMSQKIEGTEKFTFGLLGWDGLEETSLGPPRQA
ncbi:related to peroxisomal short-chain alcohol dehydrogenase [Phialocephala subalpina]|uniref:Related to peroxisomal short-chain alcohol dehydrogenase n=1 Tax=Phialocephala subalpina TaxID=576137 RepID=A0A1L7XFL0_9HELO|nr:related to peroxisomal short-chain alcohol dehydrogenase [Phialocephala subalpina]